METGFMNRIIGLVLALVVGGLLVGGLLIPSIEGMTTTELTYINVGSPYQTTDTEDAETHTIVISKDDGGNLVITTDGKTDTLPDFSLYGSATILFAENTFIRLTSAGAVNVYGSTNASTYGNASIGTASAENPITITITGTTAAITTYTINNVQAYIAPEGPLVLSKNPYVHENSTVYVGALNTIAGTGIAFVLYGPLDDLIKKGVWPNGRGIGEVTVNLENKTTDLYKLDRITAEATNDGNVFGTMTINYLLAPKEVVYENPAYIGSTNAVIMGVVSLLGIVALIVVAANGIRNKY